MTKDCMGQPLPPEATASSAAEPVSAVPSALVDSVAAAIRKVILGGDYCWKVPNQHNEWWAEVATAAVEAATVDLLPALRAVTERLDEYVSDFGATWPDDPEPEMIAAARAAIAKATEGRS